MRLSFFKMNELIRFVRQAHRAREWRVDIGDVFQLVFCSGRVDEILMGESFLFPGDPMELLPLRFAGVVVTGAVFFAWIIGFASCAGMNLVDLSDDIYFILICVLPVAAIAIDSAYKRATFGMRRVNLLFVGQEGFELTIGRSLSRVIVGVTVFPLWPISVLVIFFNKDCRSLADLICGTRIIIREKTRIGSYGFPVIMNGKTEGNHEDEKSG
jgi:uncharacterized RDD family membrane protein YckC